MSTDRNWPIYGGDGTAITATATSAATLIANTPAAVMAEDVMIDNPGTVDVYVKAGPDNTVVASLTSVRVPAGSLQPYAKGPGNSYLAVRTASGSQAVVVHVGSGQ